MSLTIDTWREADGIWVDAPASSHVKRFRPVFFKVGRHAIEVTFKLKVSEKTGKVYPERSYRYWQKSDENGLASVVNVWNALIAAESPGEVIDAWLKKGAWSVAEI